METAVDSITFMGHRINAQGLSVDPEKVSAITEMKDPKTLKNYADF